MPSLINIKSAMSHTSVFHVTPYQKPQLAGVNVRIHITKDILKRSRMCGKNSMIGSSKYIMQNCAFALAVRDIFPNAGVGRDCIFPDPTYYMRPVNSVSQLETILQEEITGDRFPITYAMQEFINRFDLCTPQERDFIEPNSFDLFIPDWAVLLIAQDHVEAARIIANSPTLELITQ